MMTNNDAELALFDAVIGREGRYSNDPADRGGETIWGITAAVARACGYVGPMVDMPRDIAVAIYRRRYWIAPGLDRLAAIDMKLAVRLLDIAVNMGPPTAIGFLQRALNALNRQGTDYPDIAADGVLGSATLGAVQALLGHRGDDGRRVLLGMVTAQQSVRYLEIAERNPTQETFEFGWQLNRTIGLGAG